MIDARSISHSAKPATTPQEGPMDDFDLATQNTINHYRNKLHDIHTWHQQLNDTMTTITSHTMTLTPTNHTPTPKLPGGDALAMLAPYNPNATVKRPGFSSASSTALC